MEYPHSVAQTPPEHIHTSIVSRVFRIEDITLGEPKQYLVRYRGQLIKDSVDAYTELEQAFRPHGITPLFRKENDQQIIFLMQGVVRPKQTNIRANVIMFIITLFSVMLAGAQPDGPMPPDFLGQLWMLTRNIFSGWPFAVSLLSILLAHEFGHYLAGRYHKTNVTLPYFIPLPFSLLGTMGAFIQMKEHPRNKRVLLDIGIAGPLAGLVVAIPVLLIGLSLSYVDTLVRFPGGLMEGNSILYLLAKYIVFGELLPAPIDYGGMSAIAYWVRYIFVGGPIPFGGLDVHLHPVAWAGWAGLLVTALNLIPAGQLDGGHIVYVLFGKKLRRALPIILIILFILGFSWQGWWLWMLLLVIMGRGYAEPLDQITELDQPRKRLAWMMFVIFVLVFTPVPLVLM